MKRFINTSLLFLLIIFMSLVAWYYVIKPEIEGNANFLRTNAEPFTVTVPLGGKMYVDVSMDGVNTVLEETNQLTLWRFNNGRIVRTTNHEPGHVLAHPVSYTSNKEVFRKFDNYYISVSSQERYVDVARESLMINEPYEAPCPEMTEENQIHKLPDVEIPTGYENDGIWKLPKDIEKIVLAQSSNDMSYHKDDWYFNYNFRYQKHSDAVIDAATRVCALSKRPLDWWFDDGNMFVAKAGTEYACVLQQDYTSCYFISSNDLGYILLNLEV